MNQMYEDANSVMVPDSTALREVYHVFHYGVPQTVSELFGEVGPLDPNLSLEVIDDDPAINALLAAENL